MQLTCTDGRRLAVCPSTCRWNAKVAEDNRHPKDCSRSLYSLSHAVRATVAATASAGSAGGTSIFKATNASPDDSHRRITGLTDGVRIEQSASESFHSRRWWFRCRTAARVLHHPAWTWTRGDEVVMTEGDHGMTRYPAVPTTDYLNFVLQTTWIRLCKLLLFIKNI